MRVGWPLVSSNDRYFILSRCSYVVISNAWLALVACLMGHSFDCYESSFYGNFSIDSILQYKQNTPVLHTISNEYVRPWPIILVSFSIFFSLPLRVLVVTHAALNFHSNSISSSIENSTVEWNFFPLRIKML